MHLYNLLYILNYRNQDIYPSEKFSMKEIREEDLEAIKKAKEILKRIEEEAKKKGIIIVKP